MRRILLSLTALVVIIFNAVFAANAVEEAHGMLYPWISPDGRHIAFSYQGDIWVSPVAGGQARRLTVSVAFDRSPRWSPDGSKLAFCSNRDGNYDIYVIPSNGGDANRLTYSDANDYPGDWSPDGREVLFTTYRHFPGSQMMAIDVETLEERLILWDNTSLRYPRYSPDGTQIAFGRGPSSYTRLGYRGAGNSQIWVMDVLSSHGRRLDEWDGGQFWAQWSADGNSVYYAADRDGRRSMYAVDANGGKPHEVLKITGKDINYTSVANDGTAVVWADGSIYVGEVSPRGLVCEPRRISISIGSDSKYEYVTREVFNTADEAVSSPDGKWLALVIRGDIYIQPVSRTPEEEVDAPRGGEAVNFTNTPGREWMIQWHPECDSLVFVSDKDGDQNIYQMNLNTREWKRLTNTREVDINPQLSPDGTKAAFYRGEGDLIVLDLDTMCERRVARGITRRGVWYTALAWSPDSEWLAYTQITPAYDRDIWLVKPDGSEEPRNITQYPTSNWGPLWTADRKNIVFVSYREGEYSRVYLLPLRPPEILFSDEMEFGRPDDDEEEEASDEGREDKDTSDGAVVEEEEQLVEIDFRNIENRARVISEALTVINNIAVSPDGKTCIYQASTTENDYKLWAVNLLTGESNYVAISAPLNWLDWNADSGSYGIYEGGRVVKIEMSGSEVQGLSNVAVTARAVVDRPAELLAMYDEAYRNLKYGFYDPRLHGRDMDAAYRKYRRMIEHAVTHEEFEIFTTFLLGELNASHLGIWGDTSFEGIGASVGMLGVHFNPHFEGRGLEVVKVLEMGPSDRDESRLFVGDVICKVNGKSISRSENFYGSLDGTIGRTVHLEVQRANGLVEDVRIRPISRTAQRNLEYEQWVRDNRSYVESISNGRVTYLHIQRMYDDCLYRFERDLFGCGMNYDAVIIDVRYNGGGYIAEQLFEILGRRPSGMMQRRTGPKHVTPAKMYRGVKVCMTNQHSFSNAEMFAYGFRELGFGKVVGMPTNGGVIGTRDYELLDGTMFRIPLTGRYRLDGTNMENNPVEPDVWVQAPLGTVNAEDDPQLRKAVEVALDELRMRPATCR